jgi:hypothetical protein
LNPRIRGRLGLVLPALLLCAHTAAARIHGYVRDASSGEALIGANVQLLDTRLGSATNLDGYFVIPGGASGPIRLLASYAGYESVVADTLLLPGQDLLLTLSLAPVSILLEELVITAERTEQERMMQEVNAGQVRVDAQRLRLAPVLIQTDVLRAFQSLPGVLPSSDFSSELNIRGSGSDESLIVLDGVEVYNPSHLGGIFSSFIPSTVKHADLTRSSYGGPPRRAAGGRAAGVHARGQYPEAVHGPEPGAAELQRDARGPALRHGPKLLDGGDAPFSYLDLATRLLTPDNQVPFYFTDFQGRASLVPGTWDRDHPDGLLGRRRAGCRLRGLRFRQPGGHRELAPHLERPPVLRGRSRPTRATTASWTSAARTATWRTMSSTDGSGAPAAGVSQGARISTSRPVWC